MAESLASSSKSVNEPSTMQPAAPVSSLTSKFLSERAQMEIERRERQKRLRNQPSSEDLRVDDDEDDEEMEPPAKRQHLSSSSGVRTNTQKPRHPRAGPSGTDMATIDQVFWNGECRQTATRYADPRKDGMNTFRLTEVLGQVPFSMRQVPDMMLLITFLTRNQILLLRSCHPTPLTFHGFMNSSIVLYPSL